MTTMNIEYKTEKIREYYETHRRQWEDFYPSERIIFERVAKRGLGSVLDIGCAAGGLGHALHNRFGLRSYVGVDINRQAIEAARENPPIPSAVFHAADILEQTSIPETAFDTVASLSCADWNLETEAILRACWNRVASGGNLIVSLRLTNRAGVNNLAQSFQFIDFGATERVDESAEKANYVVFNVHDALRLIHDLEPKTIQAYGYWGPPSSTARTPYDRLVFAVIAIEKGPRTSPDNTPDCKLELPLDLLV